MGNLKYMEHLELTGQQSDGLAVMVVLAVLLYVLNIPMPLERSSNAPDEPFSKGEKGTMTIALSVDGQERGVYFMPPGATLSDLMPAIRTTIPREFDSDIGSHQLLTGDNIHLTVVAPSSPVIGKMSAAQSLALDLPIDINKVSFEELILVPGIGERTAAQIIALRGAKGSLRSLDELQELTGIKEIKFAKLKNYFFASP
ncbi:MAG: helix-hairpin-helix domain-containing protein, partial [Deltaproteobacteria bacterium]|nr:helix-hairpin-helix domain-containing protein [Deltaproteobacteria bacterium]